MNMYILYMSEETDEWTLLQKDDKSIYVMIDDEDLSYVVVKKSASGSQMQDQLPEKITSEGLEERVGEVEPVEVNSDGDGNFEFTIKGEDGEKDITFKIKNDNNLPKLMDPSSDNIVETTEDGSVELSHSLGVEETKDTDSDSYDDDDDDDEDVDVDVDVDDDFGMLGNFLGAELGDDVIGEKEFTTVGNSLTDSASRSVFNTNIKDLLNDDKVTILPRQVDTYYDSTLDMVDLAYARNNRVKANRTNTYPSWIIPIVSQNGKSTGAGKLEDAIKRIGELNDQMINDGSGVLDPSTMLYARMENLRTLTTGLENTSTRNSVPVEINNPLNRDHDPSFYQTAYGHKGTFVNLFGEQFTLDLEVDRTTDIKINNLLGATNRRRIPDKYTSIDARNSVYIRIADMDYAFVDSKLRRLDVDADNSVYVTGFIKLKPDRQINKGISETIRHWKPTSIDKMPKLDRNWLENTEGIYHFEDGSAKELHSQLSKICVKQVIDAYKGETFNNLKELGSTLNKFGYDLQDIKRSQITDINFVDNCKYKKPVCTPSISYMGIEYVLKKSLPSNIKSMIPSGATSPVDVYSQLSLDQRRSLMQFRTGRTGYLDTFNFHQNTKGEIYSKVPASPYLFTAFDSDEVKVVWLMHTPDGGNMYYKGLQYSKRNRHLLDKSYEDKESTLKSRRQTVSSSLEANQEKYPALKLDYHATHEHLIIYKDRLYVYDSDTDMYDHLNTHKYKQELLHINELLVNDKQYKAQLDKGDKILLATQIARDAAIENHTVKHGLRSVESLEVAAGNKILTYLRSLDMSDAFERDLFIEVLTKSDSIVLTENNSYSVLANDGEYVHVCCAHELAQLQNNDVERYTNAEGRCIYCNAEIGDPEFDTVKFVDGRLYLTNDTITKREEVTDDQANEISRFVYSVAEFIGKYRGISVSDLEDIVTKIKSSITHKPDLLEPAATYHKLLLGNGVELYNKLTSDQRDKYKKAGLPHLKMLYAHKGAHITKDNTAGIITNIIKAGITKDGSKIKAEINYYNPSTKSYDIVKEATLKEKHFLNDPNAGKSAGNIYYHIMNLHALLVKLPTLIAQVLVKLDLTYPQNTVDQKQSGLIRELEANLKQIYKSINHEKVSELVIGNTPVAFDFILEQALVLLEDRPRTFSRYLEDTLVGDNGAYTLLRSEYSSEYEMIKRKMSLKFNYHAADEKLEFANYGLYGFKVNELPYVSTDEVGTSVLYYNRQNALKQAHDRAEELRSSYQDLNMKIDDGIFNVVYDPAVTTNQDNVLVSIREYDEYAIDGLDKDTLENCYVPPSQILFGQALTGKIGVVMENSSLKSDISCMVTDAYKEAYEKEKQNLADTIPVLGEDPSQEMPPISITCAPTYFNQPDRVYQPTTSSILPSKYDSCEFVSSSNDSPTRLETNILSEDQREVLRYLLGIGRDDAGRNVRERLPSSANKLFGNDRSSSRKTELKNVVEQEILGISELTQQLVENEYHVLKSDDSIKDLNQALIDGLENVGLEVVDDLKDTPLSQVATSINMMSQADVDSDRVNLAKNMYHTLHLYNSIIVDSITSSQEDHTDTIIYHTKESNDRLYRWLTKQSGGTRVPREDFFDIKDVFSTFRKNFEWVTDIPLTTLRTVISEEYSKLEDEDAPPFGTAHRLLYQNMFMYDIAIHMYKINTGGSTEVLTRKSSDTDQTWATKLVQKLPELGYMIDSLDEDKIKKNSIFKEYIDLISDEIKDSYEIALVENASYYEYIQKRELDQLKKWVMNNGKKMANVSAPLEEAEVGEETGDQMEAGGDDEFEPSNDEFEGEDGGDDHGDGNDNVE